MRHWHGMAVPAAKGEGEEDAGRRGGLHGDRRSRHVSVSPEQLARCSGRWRRWRMICGAPARRASVRSRPVTTQSALPIGEACRSLHLLIGIGIAIAAAGVKVHHTTCANLVNELAEAADDRQLSKVIATTAGWTCSAWTCRTWNYADPAPAGGLAILVAVGCARW